MTETIARHRALTGRKTGREPGQRRVPRFWWQTSRIEGHRFERAKGPWFRQYGSTKRAGLISGPVPVYGLAELVVDDDGLSVHFLEHGSAAPVEVDDVGALRDLRDALTVFLDRNS